MRVAVVGCGAVGARTARQLSVSAEVDRVICAGGTEASVERTVAALGQRAVAHRGRPGGVDVDDSQVVDRAQEEQLAGGAGTGRPCAHDGGAQASGGPVR